LTGKDICVYEIKTGELIHTLKNHFKVVNCCCFHPSLHELYSCSNDGLINIWSPLCEVTNNDEAKPMESVVSDWSDSSEHDDV